MTLEALLSVGLLAGLLLAPARDCGASVAAIVGAAERGESMASRGKVLGEGERLPDPGEVKPVVDPAMRGNRRELPAWIREPDGAYGGFRWRPIGEAVEVWYEPIAARGRDRVVRVRDPRDARESARDLAYLGFVVLVAVVVFCSGYLAGLARLFGPAAGPP